MSESPKKIWFDIEECSAGPVKFNDDEIPYICADIVDELVEALKYVLKCWDDDRGLLINDSMEKARAALKKLEESHD